MPDDDPSGAYRIDPAVSTARFAADALRLAPDLDTAWIGLAVSGGPDSLALLLLAHRAFPGRIVAATVDHGLRPEAAEEARLVAAVCADLGIPHQTLHPAEPIVGNIQSSARAARYYLLARWCAAEGLALLATAHHADDQAETVMMRLLRGSGVGGLAGVRATGRLSAGIRVVRPLLAWRRSELATVVAAAGLASVDDPSNRDPRFDRVRMRGQIAAAPWIDPVALSRSAAALADAEAALDWATDTAWLSHVTADDQRVVIRPDGLPDEIVRRLVLRTLAHIRADPAPRGNALQSVLAALRRGEIRTLAGVKCRGGSTWIFTAAPPRRGN